jgi:hypothetical protein
MRIAVLQCCALVMASSLMAAPASAVDLAVASKCTAIVNATQRLACYDAAFAVTPPPPATQFGDNDHLQQQRTPKVELPKKLDLTVTHAAPLGQGLFRLTLDNGQVWDTRAADWALTFQSGDVVTISHLPLGGYQISMARGAGSVAVKRVK